MRRKILRVRIKEKLKRVSHNYDFYSHSRGHSLDLRDIIACKGIWRHKQASHFRLHSTIPIIAISTQTNCLTHLTHNIL